MLSGSMVIAKSMIDETKIIQKAFDISSENAVYAKPVVVMNDTANPVNTKQVGA